MNIIQLSQIQLSQTQPSQTQPSQTQLAQTQLAQTQFPQQLNDLVMIERAKKKFDPQRWIDEKATTFNEYMKSHNLQGCVVSVSGGVDSAVTFLLAKYAMGQPDSPIKKIMGICQPIRSTHSVWSRALELEDDNTNDATRNVTISVLDQSDIFKDLVYEVKNKVIGVNDDERSFADGQLKSYMRTPLNYYVSQLLSAKGLPSIVLGTGNKDEDQYLGYFCKAGDGVVDVQLISDLHKSEVYSVGKILNVPKSILEAPPTADLWEGQTDEDEMGFPYDFVELLSIYNEMSNDEKASFESKCIKEEGVWEYFVEKRELAEQIHKRNRHKFAFPVNL